MKKVYVIGHKNPDTDSIVSAIAYATLKQELGETNVFPARCGKINLQTEYILKRFKITPPEFLSDMIPKVSHHMSEEPVTLYQDMPLWDAMQVLSTNRFRMIPLVDENKKYVSTLHYNTFAEHILKKIDPQKNTIIQTSVQHLARTLKAQPIVIKNENEIFSAQIVVAASKIDTLREFIDLMPVENTIVIVGDREDIHEYVIKRKVRVLIVSAGRMISKEMKDLAEENNVSVLTTPFHTAGASWLALHSMPVRYAGDKELKPVAGYDYIKNIKERFSDSLSRSLPVVDEDMRVIGVLTQSDLMKEPNIGVILVDHNELSQSADGVSEIRILEIIDHHRLGNPSTKYPITFVNRPVGSTSTIIANLYRDYKVPIKKEIAAILLAGILSDTLTLRSATTTPIDRDTAEYLSQITDLNIEEFGKDITNAAAIISSKPAEEIINMDMKTYKEGNISFSVSQVEVNSPDEILGRSDEILEYLSKLKSSNGFLFSSLLVTDLSQLSSYLLISGDDSFIRKIEYPKEADHIFFLKDVLSRKKQLMPYILEIIRRL
ncbi:MAG TPA: putative manganese-dependent inorganic diphosphatase [Spirochaetota bacterium]|jgi:manganese-dependent inorganic pyrophosphatase|nr:putative manganese-dependent inorganic diphosphatase [Spirochaetota bacterium]HOQ11392.1 putative manganese-dependent inorganic diphosphatase [Spirochaetota bacterium]